MWGVDFPSDEPLAYTVIGVQYPTGGSEKKEETTTAVPPPPEAQALLIKTLDTLLTPSSPSSAAPAPAHTDRLLEDGRGHLAGWATRLWLSYWPTARAYDDWARSPAVAAFWAALAPDAGVYREVVRIAPPRAQLGTNHDDRPAGLGHVGALKPQFDKALYWGCYRDRYRASSELSSCPGRRSGEEEENNNRMDSPLGALPTPRRSSREGGTTVRRRPGRTTITRLPDNLCFVVEGQDHAALSPREKQHWFAHFDGPVTRWMQDLMAAGPAEGLLDAKICYADDSGRYHDTDTNNDQTPPALTYNKKVQLFWFLDHCHMEKIGRANKGHVALRNNFIQSYGPGGGMADEGNLLLWVETSVLKADEIEAEYIGVVEGTGFLAYDHHPEFQSTPTA